MEPSPAATVVVEPADLDGDRVEIAGDAYRHLFRARRLGRSEALRVVDGAGRARWGVVVLVDRRRAILELGDPAPAGEPARRLHLIVAPPRPERLRWLVEKTTEVGVASITVVASRRSERPVSDGQLEALVRVARAAVEQCHRSLVPPVRRLRALDDALRSRGPGDGALWLLDPAAEGSLGDPGEAPCTVAVGPEGGFSPDELELFAAAGARRARLGSRVLRVETAAVAAAALLLLR